MNRRKGIAFMIAICLIFAERVVILKKRGGNSSTELFSPFYTMGQKMISGATTITGMIATPQSCFMLFGCLT